MPLILTPEEWDSQPPYAVGINRGNPLGAKARFAVIGGPAPVELCRGIPMSGVQGTVEVTPGGLAYVLPTTASTWAGPVADLDTYSGSLTVCWYGMLRSNSTAILLDSLGSYGWYFYTTSYAAGVIQAVFGSQWGGFGVFPPRPALTDNTLHSLSVRYDDASATVEFFLDGVSLGPAATFNKDPGATSNQMLGMYDGSGGATPHKMLTCQAFKGALSDAEILTFHANPWGIFEQDDEQIWLPSAGGAITLTAASATQANSGSSGVITQTHVLVGAASAQANAASSGAIVLSYPLAGALSTQANTASGGSIAAGVNLTSANCAQGNTSSAGAISQTLTLTGAASAQANTGSSGAIAQASAVSGAACLQANATSTGAISQAHALTGAASSQENLSGTGAIAQALALTGQTCVQGNASSGGVIVQAYLLIAAACAQANASSSGAILKPLVAAASSQANSSASGAITRVQTLIGENSVQGNRSSTGATNNGIVTEAALTTGIPDIDRLKKPGIPADTPDWLKTTLEILEGRRGNAIVVSKPQTLTFSATPTKAECEALYAYVAENNRALNSLIVRFDS